MTRRSSHHLRGTPRWRTLCAALAIAVAGPIPATWSGPDEAAPADGSQEAPIRIAFSDSMFVDVNENDAGAAVRVWAQMLGTEHGIPVNPVVKILRGTNSIIEALQSHSVDAITLTTDEYWAIRDRSPLGSFVFGVRRGGLTEVYLLLVHQDCGLDRIADLRGRSVIQYSNPRASLAPAWIDSLLGRETEDRSAEFFGRTTHVSKLTRAMLPVFFRQADACIVTREGFATASELNPQVGQKLRVLAASPAVVPVVFGFRNDYHSPFREKLIAQIGEVNVTPAGRQFMTLFHCDTLVEAPESSMDTAFELLAARQRSANEKSGAAARGEVTLRADGKAGTPRASP